MKNETEFVVAAYANQTFLTYYRKVFTYSHCVFLIEEYNGEEVERYVIPKNFCKQYNLVEVLFSHE